MSGLALRNGIKVLHVSNVDVCCPTQEVMTKEAKGQFEVTTINPITTPNVLSDGCMDGYHAVMVSTWSRVDQKKLGDLLANFVDSGGTVVRVPWNNVYNQPGIAKGRFEDDEYAPLIHEADKAYYVSIPATLGIVPIPDHPIMSGVKKIALSRDKRRPQLKIGNGDVELIANWSDGTPLAAVRKDKPGLVVDLTVCYGPTMATGDSFRLLTNALRLVHEPGKNMDHSALLDKILAEEKKTQDAIINATRSENYGAIPELLVEAEGMKASKRALHTYGSLTRKIKLALKHLETASQDIEKQIDERKWKDIDASVKKSEEILKTILK